MFLIVFFIEKYLFQRQCFLTIYLQYTIIQKQNPIGILRGKINCNSNIWDDLAVVINIITPSE